MPLSLPLANLRESHPRLPALCRRVFEIAVSGKAVDCRHAGRHVPSDRCKQPRQLTREELAADPRYAALGFKIGETLHAPVGCERCSGTGYRGRNGVFEIIEMNEEVRSLISATANSDAIERAALRGGMTTMLDDAVAKCRAGVTSPAEALRVVALR